MGRIWDIIPPHPRPRKQTTTSRKKTKNASLFFGLIIIIFVGLFLYTASIKPPTSIDGVTTASPQNSASPHQLLIKILNGTGRSEEGKAVADILTENGFKVTKTENALNLYDQTIVYYESNQEKYAQEIAASLTKYQAKTQQFSQENPYDLIIVIGAR